MKSAKEIAKKWFAGGDCSITDLVLEAQRDALLHAAEIADKPDALFERGQTMNPDNTAGKIAKAIRAAAAVLLKEGK